MNRYCLCLVALPAISLSSAPGPDSPWIFSEIDDPSGYGSLYVMRQDAGNLIRNESANGEVTPVLAFGCTPGKSAVTAHIDWQRFISSFSTEVGFKVETGGFTWLKWKVDGSEKVTMSPSADDTKKLIDAVGAGKALVVEVSPYSESPVTVTFDLAGFEGALSELELMCAQGK